ncbi:MAG: GDSL-type esterase/lipase family protein, partial [Verrucomicrobiota bacterium]
GIRGDTSEGVLARLDELLCSEPRCVVLMIGTNDLWSDLSPVDVKGNIVEITRILEDGLPDARLIVQTILPTRQGEKINRRVKAINHLLRSHDWGSIELMDTYNEFSNERGELMKVLTTDGVHLNDLGYKRWAAVLKETLG